MFASLWEYASEFSKKANENPVVFAIFLIAALITIFALLPPLYSWWKSARKAMKMACRYCLKLGNDPNTAEPNLKPCPTCKGRGHFPTDRIGQPNCVFCKGTARIVTARRIEPCKVCEGIGLEPKP